MLRDLKNGSKAGAITGALVAPAEYLKVTI